MTKQLKKYWPVLLVLAIVLIAYGQTLGMYFWQDDSALIFKLQNPEGPAGSFGSGLWERGAYQYLVIPFVPFYSLFKLEPFGYFLVGFITYILATGAFWLFVKRLFESKKTAFIATLIFAAGFVGSDIMFRVINSWQTNIGLILAFLMFASFIGFIKTKKISLYFVALVLYWLNTELVYIRSHSLIIPILTLDIVLSLGFLRRDVIKLVLRQIPFWIIFKTRYLSDPGFGAPTISKLANDIFLKGEIEKTASFFANVGNVFVPTNIQVKFLSFFPAGVYLTSFLVFIIFVVIFILIKRKLHPGLLALITGFVFNLVLYEKGAFWYQDAGVVISGLIGIETLILTLLSKSPILILGVIIISSQVFGYYIQYPYAILATTHRYFSYALIGYAIFFAWLVSRIVPKKRAGILLLAVLIPNLYFGVTYQAKILRDRSVPTRNFYKALTTFVPTVEKGDVFYFDVAKEGGIPTQFGDFFSVGSMPETTALAIYYGVDRYDIQMFTEFDELASKLAKGEFKIGQIHSFFYSKSGLINTTHTLRDILARGQEEATPMAPLLGKVRIGAFLKTENLDFKQKLPFSERKNILEYLAKRRRYYKNVRITSSSEWKFREVRNVFDDDLDTTWQGHRIKWGDTHDEKLTVDLGRIENVSRVIWVNWKTSLSPTKYKILTSLDGRTWKEVRNVSDPDGKKDREVVIDEFEPVFVRFITMDFQETITNDSPALLEFEVVEEKFNKVDPAGAWNYLRNPMSLVGPGEVSQLLPLISPLATFTVSWDTDKNDKYNNAVSLPLSLGTNKKYEIIIPAGGTTLSNLKFTSNLPVDLDVGTINFRNLSLEELKMRGLVKNFTEN